jgi:hypothetical protein
MHLRIEPRAAALTISADAALDDPGASGLTVDVHGSGR